MPILDYKGADPARCKAAVWHPMGNWGQHSQCQRSPKRDGYCTQHHPDSEAKRRAASEAKWRAEWDARQARSDRQDAEEAVVEAAERLIDSAPADAAVVFPSLKAAVEELRAAREKCQ